MNEIMLIKLDCNKCNNKEVWSINEFEFVGDYPIECVNCHSEEMNITLNNKWGMEMTRKDYIRFARAIKNNTQITNTKNINKHSLIDDLSIMFKDDNSLFDRARFIDACEWLDSTQHTQ